MSERLILDGLWSFRPVFDADAAETGRMSPLPGAGDFSATPIHVPGYWNTFPPTTGGDWGAYGHYDYPRNWDQAPAGWYRREFEWERVRGRGAHATRRDAHTTRLRFDAVAGHAHVWLNQHYLGENRDCFLPFEFDVTEYVRRTGPNELLVLVAPREKAGGLWLTPPGSWTGWHLRGIWQSVHVIAVPADEIRDVFLQPSVRKQRVTVDVTVARHADGPPVELSVAIRDGARSTLDLGTRPARLTSGQETIVRFEADWPDARCWSPDDPHLYVAEATLAAGGRTVQTHSVRFGFREFWIDGTGFRLNGQRIRLFGDSWHYMGSVQQNPAYARTWFEFAKKMGVNAIRTHAMPYPPCYFDVADELGMLIIDESAVYGSAGDLAYDEPRFWDACREHMRRLVRRDRNHPSIIFWSACNETVWRGGQKIYPELISLADEARKLDPTRFVSFDENDCDVGGAAPLHAGHYGTPRHWDSVWNRRRPLVVHEFSALYHGGPDDACPYGGEAPYADFDARLAATGEDAADMFFRLRRLGAASITPWNLNWYGLRPLPEEAITEIPAALTAGGAPLERIGPHAITLNYGFVPDFPPFRPNPALAPLARCYARQCFFLPRRAYQGFGGRTVTLRPWLFNDTDTPLAAALHWSVRAGGRTLAESWARVELDAHGFAEAGIGVELPKISEARAMEARLALHDAASPEETLCEETWPLHIHPPIVEPAGDAVRRVYVWDPDGRAAGLDVLGAVQLVEDEGALAHAFSDSGATLVLVSASDRKSKDRRDADDSRCEDRRDADAPPRRGRQDADDSPCGRALREWVDREDVRAWLRAGGRIVVLPGGVEADPSATPAPIERAYRRAFAVDAGETGVLRGLGDAHWRDWDDDGNVATHVYERPQSGPAQTPLVVGDAASGLANTPLVITPVGAGHVVLSGLDLAGRCVDTPAAALILQRVVHEALPADAGVAVEIVGGQAFRGDALFGEVGLRRGKVGQAERAAARGGAGSDGGAVAAAARAEGVCICDGSDAGVLDDAAIASGGLEALFDAGGTLLLMNLTPETAAAWSARLGVRLELEADERYNVACRGRSPLLGGVTNHDLCWVDRGEKQAIVRYTLERGSGGGDPPPAPSLGGRGDVVVETVATRWEDYQGAHEQCKAAMMVRRMAAFAGPRDAVVEIPRGRGRIIISQLLLREARGVFRERARRILSRWLDHLGAARAEYAHPLAPGEAGALRPDGYIAEWAVLGPFAGGGGHPLDCPFVDEAALDPREGSAVGERLWTRVRSAHKHVDLKRALGKLPERDRVAYAAIRVFAKQDRSVLLDAPDMVTLRLGSDGGNQVLLNGAVVARHDFVREFAPDVDRVDCVPLRRGWNLLVVKLHNPSGPWRFSARFLSATGEPIGDLGVNLKADVRRRGEHGD